MAGLRLSGKISVEKEGGGEAAGGGSLAAPGKEPKLRLSASEASRGEGGQRGRLLSRNSGARPRLIGISVSPQKGPRSSQRASHWAGRNGWERPAAFGAPWRLRGPHPEARPAPKPTFPGRGCAARKLQEPPGLAWEEASQDAARARARARAVAPRPALPAAVPGSAAPPPPPPRWAPAWPYLPVPTSAAVLKAAAPARPPRGKGPRRAGLREPPGAAGARARVRGGVGPGPGACWRGEARPALPLPGRLSLSGGAAGDWRRPGLRTRLALAYKGRAAARGSICSPATLPGAPTAARDGTGPDRTHPAPPPPPPPPPGNPPACSQGRQDSASTRRPSRSPSAEPRAPLRPPARREGARRAPGWAPAGGGARSSSRVAPPRRLPPSASGPGGGGDEEAGAGGRRPEPFAPHLARPERGGQAASPGRQVSARGGGEERLQARRAAPRSGGPASEESRDAANFSGPRRGGGQAGGAQPGRAAGLRAPSLPSSPARTAGARPRARPALPDLARRSPARCRLPSAGPLGFAWPGREEARCRARLRGKWQQVRRPWTGRLLQPRLPAAALPGQLLAAAAAAAARGERRVASPAAPGRALRSPRCCAPMPGGGAAALSPGAAGPASGSPAAARGRWQLPLGNSSQRSSPARKPPGPRAKSRSRPAARAAALLGPAWASAPGPPPHPTPAGS
ncbi:basic proline-rich protein-like [Eublepharis macularius]|uniref:Basic proline-rich protein-like n=1 Tax=Eublepharis macularius TaxID=481883 RepID=A0AA97L7Y1_EUBMA|nr:basic proline-rich protein-like [Eublepharis macularius]